MPRFALTIAVLFLHTACADVPVAAPDDPDVVHPARLVDAWGPPDGHGPVLPWRGALRPAETLFDPQGLHVVELTMAPAAWQAYLDGVDQPDSEQVYDWQVAQVRWDGLDFAQVGVRGFGNGSQLLNPDKPNLRLKFDKVIEAKGPDGKTNLRLKASGQDPTFLREPLAYDLVRALGGHAPRYGWANVRVNGEDLGLYQVLEHADKRMYAYLFGDDDGAEYQALGGCVGLDCPGGKCEDIAKYWLGDPGDGAELVAFAAAVHKAPAADFLAVLQKHTHLDDLLAAYAVDAVLSNLDGLAAAGQNVTLYVTPGDQRLHVVFQGADLTFGNFSGAWYDLAAPWGPPNVWCKTRVDRLYERLWSTPSTRPLLLAKLRALQCGPLAPHRMVPRIVQLQNALAQHVYADPKGLYAAWELDAAYANLVGYVQKRKAPLEQLLGPCPP